MDIPGCSADLQSANFGRANSHRRMFKPRTDRSKMPKYFDEHEGTTRRDGQADRKQKQTHEENRGALYTIGRFGKNTGKTPRTER